MSPLGRALKAASDFDKSFDSVSTAVGMSEEEAIKLGERVLLEHRLVEAGIHRHPARVARVEYDRLRSCDHHFVAGSPQPDDTCTGCGGTWLRLWRIKFEEERVVEARLKSEGKAHNLVAVEQEMKRVRDQA